MSLHEELAGATSASACILCNFLRTLSGDEAADWQRELALPVRIIGNLAVVNALAKREVEISETSVRRHRTRHS